jgi:aspartate racemase
MRTLGLIGGLSWLSTETYYRVINQVVQERLGGSHSARLLMYSVEFDDFKVLQEAGDWDGVETLLADAALRLERAGAQGLALCSNTPHLVAEGLRRRIGIPLIHVVEATAAEIARRGMRTVGLLGTRFTMEHGFFQGGLAAGGIKAMVPERDAREFLHGAIFGELTRGVFKPEARARTARIIDALRSAGAEGVVFGCTELGLLLTQEDSSLPILDTAHIHARAAVDFALD